VRGAVEDQRRTALMRTHSGLHVLCGVVFRDYGALVTGGNMEPAKLLNNQISSEGDHYR
jgi:misacylated tRNA(Ala) deacylase